MKSIEQKSLEKLLQIIPDHPGIRLLHFADSGEEIPQIISSFIEDKGYEYQINCLDDTFFLTMRHTFAKSQHIHPIKFTLQRPRYMIQGKIFDYVFVTAPVAASMRENFLKRVHPIIKNGGNILIFLPKKEQEQRWEWLRLLEEHYYVASSTIDDLFAHYDVVISKKMHGWGG
ncbi:hypothetical protein MNB_SV-4-853 [hydrothermal vent metagenome]|uniref:Methyltransferase type 11 domain-containing protein n=1 Tax=hydrothermal vent metagenome TaxID=652676 RepID=A0A1W1E9D3_9ZZZZ